jgi:hypothetical protein
MARWRKKENRADDGARCVRWHLEGPEVLLNLEKLGASDGGGGLEEPIFACPYIQVPRGTLRGARQVAATAGFIS